MHKVTLRVGARANRFPCGGVGVERLSDYGVIAPIFVVNRTRFNATASMTAIKRLGDQFVTEPFIGILTDTALGMLCVDDSEPRSPNGAVNFDAGDIDEVFSLPVVALASERPARRLRRGKGQQRRDRNDLSNRSHWCYRRRASRMERGASFHDIADSAIPKAALRQ